MPRVLHQVLDLLHDRGVLVCPAYEEGAEEFDHKVHIHSPCYADKRAIVPAVRFRKLLLSRSSARRFASFNSMW